MKLLHVRDVLKREENIQRAEVEYDIIQELGDKTVRYAILSHRWEDGSEVTYEEMIGLMKMDELKKKEVRDRSGYTKIIKCCEQAIKDDYEWLWIDTCCIDKRSSAELSEAINSMYRWYQDAQVCYAYLNDVTEPTFPTERNGRTYDKSGGWPEWFMRGWTLQELIAPKRLEFFNKDWAPIGNKQHLAPVLEVITIIPRGVLSDGPVGKRLSVARVMSWAADRRTTRVEDRAYSLMGLFEVNMPMVYGEGKKAFQRLQLEIIRRSSDHSIFAWCLLKPRTGSFLADDPSDFRCYGHIRKVEPKEFGDKLVEHITQRRLDAPQHNSWKILTYPIHRCRLAWLRWRARALSQQLRTFTVGNAGIQVCLPVIPYSDSPTHFKAILACTDGAGPALVTIDIAFSGFGIYREPIDFDNIRKALKVYPEFQTLHLTHNQDVNENRRKFTLDDKHASYHGFTRCSTFPHESTGDAVTLSSLTDGLVVIVYSHKAARSYFAVGLGYYFGQGWVHIVCDEHVPAQEVDWTWFGKRAYDQMWLARAEHARKMSKRGRAHSSRNAHFTKHAHLPRSIWDARVVWGRWEADNFRVTVDVVQCPGCCGGPWEISTTFNDWGGLGMPGPMNTVCRSYSLTLGGWVAEVDGCSGQRIRLGDYGDCVDGILICSGNIFEDMRILGIDPEDSVYCPVVSRVHSEADWWRSCIGFQADVTTVYRATRDTHLALRQAKGISLPTNKHFMLLLKDFSTRLAGKHLVTTIIQCSEFYSVDRAGNRRDSEDDSAPDSGNPRTEAGISTPLCTIASPQVWRRGLPCAQRRERFKSIRWAHGTSSCGMALLMLYLWMQGALLCTCEYHTLLGYLHVYGVDSVLAVSAYGNRMESQVFK
ncbi:heterokaryon incompatibility protein-domain-containing protein [Pisolithus sp. B1]|nr:heterokaryon incompatibility protein-domain-containing protein [Pisolithus sp. B1]